jgi:hypothetical protein
MAAREVYTHKVRCPQCDATGTATFSEEDHPWVKSGMNYYRTCDAVTPPFVVIVPEPWYPEVHCGTCNVKAV